MRRVTREDAIDRARIGGIVDASRSAIHLAECEATKAFMAKRDNEAARWRAFAEELRERIKWAETKLGVYSDMATAADCMRGRR